MTTSNKALQNVAPATPTLPGGYTSDEVKLLQTIGGAELKTLGEVRYFLSVADRLRLDPLKRQIYAVRYGGQLTIQTGIDGYRLLAQRTGVFGGSSAPEWYSEEKDDWVDVWLEDTPPAAARVRVYRIGAVEPFVGIAHWKEYAQYTGKGNERRVNSMWSSKPAHMLAKCAEALALRRAFPAEMSGLYTAEETGAWVEPDTGVIHVPEDALPPVAEGPAYEDGDYADVPDDGPTAAELTREQGPPLYAGETIEQITAKLTGMLDGRPMSYVVPVLPEGKSFTARLIAWAEAHPDVPVAAGVFGEANDYHRQEQPAMSLDGGTS